MYYSIPDPSRPDREKNQVGILAAFNETDRVWVEIRIPGKWTKKGIGPSKTKIVFMDMKEIHPLEKSNEV